MRFRSIALDGIAVLAVAGLLALTACGARGAAGGDPHEREAPARSGLLPAPSELGRTAAVSPSTLAGSEFSGEWPSRLVTPVPGDVALFEPDWQTAAPDNDSLAFALYSLGAPQPSEYYALSLDWDEPGPDFADQWVGLADFSVNRWQWQPMTNTGVLPLGGARFFSDGDAIVAVLCLGTAPWELAQLSLVAAEAPEDICPDFTLRLLRSEEQVTLSSFRAERPVVLLVGSYT